MSDMTMCLNDLSYIPLNKKQNEPTQGDIDETSNELTQAIRNEFEELYAIANEELYPGCDYVTQIDFMAKLTYFKVKGKDIDVYLRPLIDDLKELWALKGVETIDIATGQTFNMRAIVLWTINDFPARSSLHFIYARQYLPVDIAKPIIKLCSFFKQIYSQTLMEDDMLKAQSKVVDIRLNIELIYPPVFFDIMIHLVIHLPLEALEGGPIRFGGLCKSIGLRSVIQFDHQELKKVIWYVLHNSPKIGTYRAKFKSEFPNQDMKEKFLGWFGSQILQRHIDNDLGVSASNELFALACGPTPTPISVNSYVVNDVRFVMNNRNKCCTTQKSGICSPGDKDEEMYYGQLEEIYEFSYMSFKVVLFEVKWFDTSNDGHGQSMDVDAPPDIIDVDKDNDIIDDEDALPHDLADSNDENLINVNDDDNDVAVMSSNIASGHGGDGSGDDYLPPHHTGSDYRGKGTRKPNLGGRKAGRLNIRKESRNLRLRKITNQLGLQEERKARAIKKIKIAFWADPKNAAWCVQNAQNWEKSMVICRQGSRPLVVLRDRQRGHILGVGRVLAKRVRDVLVLPDPRCTHTGDVVELKRTNKQLKKLMDMIMKISKERIPFELSSACFPQLHVIGEEYPHGHIAEDSGILSPGIEDGSVVSSPAVDEHKVTVGNTKDVNVGHSPINITVDPNSGRSRYDRAMIELRADVELKDTIIVAMPKLIMKGFYTCNIRVEYAWKPPRCACCKVFRHIQDEFPKKIGSDVAKNFINPSQAPRGVLVGPKLGCKPVKQVYRPISKKNNVNTSGNKKKYADSRKEVSNPNPFDVLNSVENDVNLGINRGTLNLDSKEANSSGSLFRNMESSSISTTVSIDQIDKIKKLIIDGKITLVNDEGKPLEQVAYPGDHDSVDEVEPVDNEMASFLASNKVGYGTNSLSKQRRKSYENADYDYAPYNDDMYEGQEIPNNIQSICDNLDIKKTLYQKRRQNPKGTSSQPIEQWCHTMVVEENALNRCSLSKPSTFTTSISSPLKPPMEECPKNPGLGVAKNLKKSSQASRGVLIGLKVGFKPSKEYRPISKKSIANTSGNKKKGVEPTKEVSNSNPFDVLNSVDNDVELGTNRETSNLASNEANSSGSSFWNVKTSSISTTPIVVKIRKLKKLIIDGKVTVVDDDGKPLKKVDYLGDHDSEDEVESVVNDMTCFMASVWVVLALKVCWNNGEILMKIVIMMKTHMVMICIKDDNVGRTPISSNFDLKLGTKVGPTATGNTPSMSSYANVTGVPCRKALNFCTLFKLMGNGVHVFSLIDGLDEAFENSPCFIRNNQLILKKWNPDVNLLKEDVGNVLVWVKLYSVPVTRSSKDGLSAIAIKIGRGSIRALLMLSMSENLPGVLVANYSGSLFWNMESSSTSTTSIAEKIDKIEKIERIIIEGKVTLVDDEGKPLAKVDSSGDHDSKDEVASVDNEMTNFLASKKVGHATNNLLEQWKENNENDDYDFDPYDDDMYEGQDIPDKIQAICDNLDIKVQGTLMMLESYINTVCLDLWGQSNYALTLIEVHAKNDLKVNLMVSGLMVSLANLYNEGYTRKTISIEYEWRPLHCEKPNKDDQFELDNSNKARISGNSQNPTIKRSNVDVSDDELELQVDETLFFMGDVIRVKAQLNNSKKGSTLSSIAYV
uniref:DUF4218 domain-containing protein n=1 Tax=Tanacetum cinerariifolium TaxID=118510 RepID=A0A6L2L9Z3_TANCI|nr:hypothetical protein [Tanacetum cinerariifolium]